MGRRIRKVTWHSLGISSWRKKELIAFCRQYDEWQEKLLLNSYKRERSNQRSVRVPEEDAVLLQKIDIVETAIRLTCPEFYEQMLYSITRGLPYGTQSVIPDSKDFYQMKMAVYGKIHEILN